MFEAQLSPLGYCIIATKPDSLDSKGNGVMLIFRKGRITNVQPFLCQFWGKNTVAVIAHSKSNQNFQNKFALIGHYSSHSRKQETDNNLTFLTNSIRQYHPGIDTLIAGDFNRPRTSMQYYAKQLNLILAALPSGLQGWTRQQKHLNTIKKSELDYYLSNKSDLVIDRFFDQTMSDHAMLTTSFKADTKSSIKQIIHKRRLCAHTSIETISRILQDPSWPNTMFIDVAAKLGRTKISKIKQSKAHQVSEAMGVVEKIVNNHPNRQEVALERSNGQFQAPKEKQNHSTEVNILKPIIATQPREKNLLRTIKLNLRSLVFNKNHLISQEAQDTFEKIRRHYPKAFFNTINTVAKAKSSATIAQDFALSDPPAPSFPEYAKSLYYKPEKSSLPWYPSNQEKIVITCEDLKSAITMLSSGKATGIDDLNDISLKQCLLSNPNVFEKVRLYFEQWINGEQELPQYLKTAKTTFLSKVESEFPELGQVRIISILPSLTKLWDTILNSKLKTEIALKAPLHTNQRGFVAGGSCLKNISELTALMNQIRKPLNTQISKIRPKEFLFFLDLKKAFDTIDRSLLISQLHKKGINNRLILAVRNLYSGMSLKVKDKLVETNIGVVQGGVSSPLLFNFFIDDMIRELNQFGTCLALADDIVVHVTGELKLKMMLNKLSQLCNQLSLSISKEKSAIMMVRRKKQKPLGVRHLFGYKVVKHYKYLGISIQDDLKFQEEEQSKRAKVQQLKSQSWILKNQNIGSASKVQILFSIFNSKWLYGSELLSTICPQYQNWLKSQWYRSLKTVLNAHANVPADLMLLKSLGTRWCCWQSQKNLRLFNKLNIDGKPQICNHPPPPIDPTAKARKTPIQLAAKQNALRVIGFQANIYFRGWHSVNNKFQKLMCDCGKQLSLKHFRSCSILSDAKSRLEAKLNYNMNQLLDEINSYRFNEHYRDYRLFRQTEHLHSLLRLHIINKEHRTGSIVNFQCKLNQINLLKKFLYDSQSSIAPPESQLVTLQQYLILDANKKLVDLRPAKSELEQAKEQIASLNSQIKCILEPLSLIKQKVITNICYNTYDETFTPMKCFYLKRQLQLSQPTAKIFDLIEQINLQISNIFSQSH